MATTTHKLKNGLMVKLGRKVPTVKPRVVKLGNYLDRPKLLRSLPESLDYWSKAKASLDRMYLNDRYGCCVISGKMHQLGVYSGNDLGAAGLVLADDREVLRQYESICGPGDNGCYIQEVLDHWRTRGLVAGGKTHNLDAYCGVDAADLVCLKTAVKLFGSVTLGIDLPSTWLDTGDGDLWDITSGRSVGGHDVPAVGFTKAGLVISTWGGLRTITWAALESGRYVDECYVQLAPEWYNDDRLSPAGVDVAGLRKALNDFANGILPDDPTEPPVPVPPSPPPAYWYPDYQVTVEGNLPAAVGGGVIQLRGEAVPMVGPGRGPGGAGDPNQAIPWALILALAAKYLPIILAGLAAGKTWLEILADILASQKQLGRG